MSWELAFRLIIAALILALLLFLLWLLLRKKQRDRERGAGFGWANADSGSESGSGDGWGDEDDGWEATRLAKEAAEAAALQVRKERLVQEILAGDSVIAQQLLRIGDMAGTAPEVVSRDHSAIVRLAKRLDETPLQVLRQAGRPVQELTFDLESTTRHEPRDHPTDYIEPAMLTDYGQLSQLLPEQQIADDDTFFARFAAGELVVMQPYEKVEERKRLYLLLDVSPSMDESMADGLTRRIWALALGFKLLLQAEVGNASYLYRPFAGKSGKFYRVEMP